MTEFREPTGFPDVAGVRFVWVELIGGWTYPAETEKCPYATADRLSWNSEEGTYKKTEPTSKIKVYFPGAVRGDDGNYTGEPKGEAGDRHLCFLNVNSRRWEVFSTGDTGNYALFELYQPFLYGPRVKPPTAEAKQLATDKDGKLSTAGTDPEPIYFPLAPRGSDGKYVGLPVGGVGMRVWCIKRNSRWEIVQNEEITAIAELTTVWTYPAGSGVPYTIDARLASYTTAGAIVYAAGRGKVYNPLAPRSETGSYVKIPHGYEGERYIVRYDPSGRRWEVTAQNRYGAIAVIQTPWTYTAGDPQSVPRARAMLFYYDRDFSQLRATYEIVYVGLALAPQNQSQTQYVQVPIGRTGDRVMVEYDPSSQVWLVTGYLAGMTYEAVLYSIIVPGGTGYATMGNLRVMVKDGIGKSLPTGTKVIVSWCESQGIFLIVEAARSTTEEGTLVAVLSGPWTYAAMPYCNGCAIHAWLANGSLGPQIATGMVVYPSAPQTAQSYAKVPIGMAGLWVTVIKDIASGRYIAVEVPGGLTYPATTAQTIAKGQTGPVQITGGPMVSAKDCVLKTGDPGITSGSRIVISWCESLGVFLIVAAECT